MQRQWARQSKQQMPMTEPRQTLSTAEREKELVDLVRYDYDVTLRTVQSVLSTGMSLRAAGFAAWGVILGVGVNNHSWAFCLFAACIALLFGYIDLLHATLYRRALARATRLESLLAAYGDRLGIDSEDETAIARTLARIELHKFGIYRTMPRKGKTTLRRQYWRARPAAVFRVVYPVLIVGALAATIIIAC